MSRAEFVDIDGHRYTEAEISAHRVVEYRCEVCGEFVAEQAMVMVQGAQLFKAGDPVISLPNLYFHPGHLATPFQAFLTAGR